MKVSGKMGKVVMRSDTGLSVGDNPNLAKNMAHLFEMQLNQPKFISQICSLVSISLSIIESKVNFNDVSRTKSQENPGLKFRCEFEYPPLVNSPSSSNFEQSNTHPKDQNLSSSLDVSQSSSLALESDRIPVSNFALVYNQGKMTQSATNREDPNQGGVGDLSIGNLSNYVLSPNENKFKSSIANQRSMLDKNLNVQLKSGRDTMYAKLRHQVKNPRDLTFYYQQV